MPEAQTQAGGTPAPAGTFVYVSNAADGDIGCYRMRPDGMLAPIMRVKAADLVGPLAASPDRRFLYAAVRSRPYSVHVYAIEPRSGALQPLSVSPLAESCPYIALDRSGRYLFGASYHAHRISVNAVGADGRVAAMPLQLIPVGRNAHSIRCDESNRYVYVPTLGSDQIFQFTFDANSGRLASNTPAVAQMQPGTGPRHFVSSADNKFLYVLSELLATVTTFALDANTGLLAEIGSASALPPDTQLVPGAPRAAAGAADSAPARNRERDIWAADIHLTPDGRFLYVSERTSSTLGGFKVNGASGKLTYLGSTPTEPQPRGFAIDARGRYLVACGERSDTISVYAIDAQSGALARLQQYPGGKGANWVEIVGFD
ncbi:MAG TPA: beta-propeller fold lactonase family protein [Burkholderiales bacterium]|nr:beta-propeller fold lactonase family protein [Burkholderiales bacterium]